MLTLQVCNLMKECFACRLFPAESRPLSEQGILSHQRTKDLIEDSSLLQNIASCIEKVRVHDKTSAPPEAGTAGMGSLTVTQLPSYLQHFTL